MKELLSLNNTKGLKVGVLGGSFNPPHFGHIKIAELAIKYLKLDKIIMLVSPGNPLKKNNKITSYHSRKHLIQELTCNKHIIVSDFEFVINNPYTFITLEKLKTYLYNCKIVWIMGEDNLYGFHNFKNWQTIISNTRLAIFSRHLTPERESSSYKGLLSKIPLTFYNYFIKNDLADRIFDYHAPAWTFINIQKILISSTRLRENNALYI